MDSFARLFPYLKPFKQRLFWSIIFGFIVAVLWGANLTVIFPVVTILLEDTPLHEYVDKQIDNAAAREADLIGRLNEMNREVADLERRGVATDDAHFLDLQRSRLKRQDEIDDARRTSWEYSWLKRYVMPFVPQNEFQAFVALLGLLTVATAVKGVFIFVQDVLIGSVAESVVMEVRKKMLAKTLDLDYQYLSTKGTSGLMSLFTYDAEQLSQGLTLLGGRMIREPLKCIACAILALFINWRLTLLSLLFIPLLGLFLARFGSMLKRASRRMMESMTSIYKVLEETFEGLKVVIAFNSADRHKAQFEKHYDQYFRKAMRVVQIDSAAKPMLELLGLLAMFVAMIPGAYLVLRGKTHIWGMRLTADVMSPAELTLLYTMLVGMLDPCRKLSGGFSRLKRSAAAIDRIYLLIDQVPAIVEPQNARPLKRHSESIEFVDVSFRYASRSGGIQRGPVLEHLNLNIKAGEVVAVVGQNGCGKSTLLNLLPRYYDPEAGEVRIDGRSLREIRLADLRNQIGIVTQDTILFDETIYENIRYGKPNAEREEIEAAARKAHVLPIVQSIPQGFDTVIGEKGKELSGGQRQRIALARAILLDPAILILDEATSAADSESEALIHEALQEFVKGRTTLLISHTMSQSLLDFVTRIVVMEHGKIVASGSHEMLLASCPLYERLYNAPSRKDVPVSRAA